MKTGLCFTSTSLFPWARSFAKERRTPPVFAACVSRSFRKRVTNAGCQVRAADQRLGVSLAISESLRRSMPGSTSSI